MFCENQQIIYRRNGEEISRLPTSEPLPLGFAVYVRAIQPFASEGHSLSILTQDRNYLVTSYIKKVDRQGNTLVVQTQNSTYEIEYVGIDLEQILQDGEDKGVNRAEDIYPAPFPNLTKEA